LNLPLLKSCDILGINWRTFTLSQASKNAENLQILFDMYERGLISPTWITFMRW
jgi:NADPH2:quinone reductase